MICEEPVSELFVRLEGAGILAGIPLCRDYPEIDNGFLVCVTEQNSKEQIDRLVAELAGGAA